MNRLASFSAASVFPAKLLVTKTVHQGQIMPIHVQLSPTNKCTLNCPFCSCSARDKSLQLSHEFIVDVMKKARKSGCQSVTITGGGEPLCHPDIVKIVKDIHAMGIKIGLVTNGTLVHGSKLDESFWKCITWCRISSGDHRVFDDSYEEQLDLAVFRGPNVDWAFSHVLTSKPNYETIRRVVQFANKHDNFTHIRLVSDLLDLKDVPAMDQIKSKLYEAKVDDSKIIYQGRKDATQGTKRCLISLLKPVIGTNGMLYPCCGTQYAQAIPSKDFGGAEMTMGSAKDIDKIFKQQKCFDGSKCATCYYSQYNKSLEILVDKIKHKEFV